MSSDFIKQCLLSLSLSVPFYCYCFGLFFITSYDFFLGTLYYFICDPGNIVAQTMVDFYSVSSIFVLFLENKQFLSVGIEPGVATKPPQLNWKLKILEKL